MTPFYASPLELVLVLQLYLTQIDQLETIRLADDQGETEIDMVD
jgi:hypothetical protein